MKERRKEETANKKKGKEKVRASGTEGEQGKVSRERCRDARKS